MNTTFDPHITFVVPAHEPGPATNGHDGCFARTGNGGLCPGVEVAAWLNSLGPDAVPYGGGTTIGQVRQSYLAGHQHLRARDPELAKATQALADARRLVREAKRRLAELQHSENYSANHSI